MRVPDGLGDTGTELWEGVTSGRTLDAPHKVLLLNACRIADRLDELTLEIGGRLLSENQRGDEVINPLVSEHRQQYSALAAVLGKLGVGELPKAKQAGKSSRDQLAAKRAARAAAAKVV